MAATPGETRQVCRRVTGRWCQTLQVEYAEAVSSLYTSKEGRFLDVLLGKSKGGK
jgi:hypothetical protein